MPEFETITKSDNPQLQLAYDYVESTGHHVFLTGKAGTGKTTFLKSLKNRSSKRLIIVAPTGVAALNAGGVTIHSFFQMPFGPLIPEIAGVTPAHFQGNSLTRKFNKTKINIIRSLDLLIIDEISMVRADLLDAIDGVLRRYRERDLPFGGVQLLMIGDLQQLPPVIKDEDWSILRQYYQTAFFFGSLALRQTDYVSIELKHIYRQSDVHFINLLNRVRENRLDAKAQILLQQRYQPGYTPDDKDGTITLTTHNAQARRLNETKLDALPKRPRTFHARIEGDFPEHLFPTEVELILKVGAQVMFVKNDSDSEKRYFNGKIGELKGFEEEGIRVYCQEDNSTIIVTPETWENTKYTLDEETKAIQPEVVGAFTQVPLKPAWAITIHKSQGLTFDKVVVDAQAAFAHGQVYVALSRCRTLEGLVLSTPIRAQGLPSDNQVLSFSEDVTKQAPGPAELEQARYTYQQTLVLDLFNFDSFHRHMARIIKRIKDHRSVWVRDPLDGLVDLGRETREHISGVAEKFHRQINAMSANGTVDIENNEALQDRIRKGCTYFIDKIKTLLVLALETVTLETDNQAVHRSVEEAIDRLLQQAYRKIAGLEVCSQGFTTKTYLKVRAEQAIETRTRKKRRPTEDAGFTRDLAHPELYQRLKTWREGKARKEAVPPNTLITLRTLINLANALPTSRTQLKRVRGIGKKTMARIGDELLDIVSAYRVATDE